MDIAGSLCAEASSSTGFWQLVLYALPQSLSHIRGSRVVTKLTTACGSAYGLFCFDVKTKRTSNLIMLCEMERVRSKD